MTTTPFGRFLDRAIDRVRYGGTQPAPPRPQPAQSWPLTRTYEAKVPVSGPVEFIMDAPPHGITWVGTFSLSGGLSTDQWFLYLGQPGVLAPAAASWTGSSQYGPLAIRDMRTVTIASASGAAAGTVIVLTFTGNAYRAGAEGDVYPLPLSG